MRYVRQEMIGDCWEQKERKQYVMFCAYSEETNWTVVSLSWESDSHPACTKPGGSLDTVAYREGGYGMFKPPPPEIPKISVESSIAQGRRTGVSISLYSSLCSHKGCNLLNNGFF